MSGENVRLDECCLGGEYLPAVSTSVDTSELSGTSAVSAVDVDGVKHVVVLTVYPASDVSSLNVSSLGSKVRNALLSLT